MKRTRDNIFYLYIYLDPRKTGKFNYDKYKFNYEPFYVGKGKGDRIYQHLNEKGSNNKLKFNKIQKIKRKGLEPIIQKLYEDGFEKDVFEKEIELIKLIGRYDLGLGPLCNLTNGGEGSSGYKFTKKDIEKISLTTKEAMKDIQIRKKISVAVTGRKHSLEIREKLRIVNNGENNPMYGKHHSLKAKEKISVAQSGKNNNMYGKHHRLETIEKMSKKTKETWKNSEIKKKMIEAMKGEKHPHTTKYIIQTPDAEIIEIITKKKVMEKLGCGRVGFFQSKKFKGYKLIGKIKINKKSI